jgi:hypothetical protein
MVTGRGPVYLQNVGGAAIGVVVSGSQEDRLGYRGQKTPWLVRRSYRGPILVRGRRIDGQGELRLARGYGEHLRELRWPAGLDQSLSPGSLRFLASTTLVRSSGCYGFQLDGLRFSETIVVRDVE